MCCTAGCAVGGAVTGVTTGVAIGDTIAAGTGAAAVTADDADSCSACASELPNGSGWLKVCAVSTARFTSSTARSASFIQAFSKIGLIPDCGGTWSLPRLVGSARAMGLTMLGHKLPAEQAAAWGLIWQCVEDADFAGTVDALAQQLASAPTRCLAATKSAILGSWRHTLAEQLDVERDMQRELGRSADFVEGVAAFGAKRAPRFTGR